MTVAMQAAVKGGLNIRFKVTFVLFQQVASLTGIPSSLNGDFSILVSSNYSFSGSYFFI